MSRKLLIEITEQEYEKIKSGILENEKKEQKQKVIVETREIPVIMSITFKFKIGENVIFIDDIGENNKEHKGEIVGYIITKNLPNGEIAKELTSIYMIQYFDDRFSDEKIIRFVEEKNVKSMIDESKDKEMLL